MMITFCFSQSKKKESSFVDPGVSEALAYFRKHQITNVSYGLSFEIPSLKEEGINSNLMSLIAPVPESVNK